MNDFLNKARLQASIGAEHYAALTLSQGMNTLALSAQARFNNLPSLKLSNPIAVNRQLRRFQEAFKPVAVRNLRLINDVIIGYLATSMNEPPYFPGVCLVYWPTGKGTRHLSSSNALFMVSSHALGRILERTDDFPVQGVITILREVLPYGAMLGMASGALFGKTLALPLRGGIGYMAWDPEMDTWVMATFVSEGLLSDRQKAALAQVTPLSITPLELISTPFDDLPMSLLEALLSMQKLARA